jgi:Tfp pilus assembly protein PilF
MHQIRRHIPFLSLAWIGILILAICIPAAAQQQPNTSARPAAPAALNQSLNESYAALHRKDYEAARQAALRVTALDPKNQLALHYLAQSYDALGDFAQAEATWKALIAINPAHATAYNNLGVVYGRMGRADEAIASYREQLEVTPRSRFANWNLGRAMAARAQWEEARQLAVVAAEVMPEEVTRWHFLGQMQLKTGHVDEARHSFDRALALPHEPMMENNIAYDLADAGFDFDKDWQLISGALEMSTRNVCEPESLADGDQCTAQLRQLAFLLDTAGWVLYRQGKIEAAEPYVLSSLAINPRGATEIHMVVLLAKTGRLGDAVRLFAQARTRPGFNRLDSAETTRELRMAAGGEAELDALLARIPAVPMLRSDAANAVVLVDATGQVIDVQPAGPGFPGLAEAAKSLTLPALAWPGHSVRSIRTIEFQRTDGRWSLVDSYAGLTPPPPPCGTPRPLLPNLVTQNSNPAVPSRSCPGAF